MSNPISAAWPKFARGALRAPLVLVLVAACQQQRGAAPDDAAADTAEVTPEPGGSAKAPGSDVVPVDSLPGSTGADAAAADTPSTNRGDTAAVAGAATASRQPGDPEWMTVDEAGKAVTFDIVAGLNATNGAWNFNGYADGDLTLNVPEGWRVTMRFSNNDANVPHSLLVSEREPPFPQVFEPQTAFPAAYTVNPQAGLAAGKNDVVRFTAGRSGRFTIPCGVPGHAASGMWDWFVVSAEVARPSVETES